MNQIEARITDLVRWVRAEGAYCCKLDNVKDLAAKPRAVRVTMRCQHHDIYSFEVHYDIPANEPDEDENSHLMRQIALGIVTNIVDKSNWPATS